MEGGASPGPGRLRFELVCDSRCVDWRAWKPKIGDLVCSNHGLLTEPAQGVIPYCPHCQHGLLTAVPNAKFGIAYREGTPAHCAGPDRHRLSPGRFRVSWEPCGCNPTMGHTRWTCGACGDVQQHPPCTRDDEGERFTPGWEQRRPHEPGR
jgi:hypothetical protein